MGGCDDDARMLCYFDWLRESVDFHKVTINCKEILTMLQSDDYGMITRGVKAAPPLRPVAAGVARGVEHSSEDCQPWWPERLRRRKKRQASPANITREVEPIIIAQSTAFNGTTLKKP